jgi:hypothetical protein
MVFLRRIKRLFEQYTFIAQFGYFYSQAQNVLPLTKFPLPLDYFKVLLRGWFEIYNKLLCLGVSFSYL